MTPLRRNENSNNSSRIRSSSSNAGSSANINKMTAVFVMVFLAIAVIVVMPRMAEMNQAENALRATVEGGGSGVLEVHFIDVGQGDAVLFLGSDFNILLDAGRHDRDDVVPYLRSAGVEFLNLIIATHPHADHIGQLDNVLNEFNVAEIWMSGDIHNTSTFDRVIDAIINSDTTYNEPRAGERYRIGSVTLEVLNPETITGNLHEGCIAVRVLYGEIAFLFTGDIEKPTEMAIIERGHNVSAQIFHLGHHASGASNSREFLERVQPEVAIYSAGIDNTYGHPHEEVVKRIEEMGITIYGTDVFGTIVVTTDGITYEVITR